MDANDVPPSRIKRVKHELHKFINHFKGENMGLIIFSSQAFLQVPLTYDTYYLNMVLDGVNTGLVGNSGTDFYYPLQMALQKHTDNKSINNTAKVIVLISDGEDFGDQSTTIVDEINNANIKLFTLGVGTESGSKIPYQNGFKKDENNNDVVSKLNNKDLKNLALLANGKYYELSNTINEIDQLIEDLDQIKGEVRKSKKINKPMDLIYHRLLIVAIVLMVLDAILSFNVLKL
jgi:Ca-activated chloride channel family protein